MPIVSFRKRISFISLMFIRFLSKNRVTIGVCFSILSVLTTLTFSILNANKEAANKTLDEKILKICLFTWMAALAILALNSILAALYLTSASNDKKYQDSIEKLIKAFSETKVLTTALSRVDLYEKMQDAAWRSYRNKTVNRSKTRFSLTSYIKFGPYKVDEDDPIGEYHDFITHLIIANEFPIRRVVSVITPDKLNWLLNHIEDCRYSDQYHLILDRDLSYPNVGQESDISPPVNLQIYLPDDIFEFGRRTNNPNDQSSENGNLHHRGAQAVSALNHHYNTLWKRCEADWILKGGKINIALIDKLKKLFDQD